MGTLLKKEGGRLRLFDTSSDQGERLGPPAPTRLQADYNEELIDYLKENEGFRSKPYEDSGFQSIGYGHQIVKGEKYTEITEEEADILLRRDVEKAVSNAKKHWGDGGWKAMDKIVTGKPESS